MAITRTITLDNVTPQEIAELFCGLTGADQATFFDRVGVISRDWPGTGWCGQSFDIAQHLGGSGRRVVKTLAGHLV